MAISFIRPLSGQPKREFAMEFAYTGAEQLFIVPYTGYYKLVAYGAQGGTGGAGQQNSPNSGGAGGKGGYVEAVFSLQKDENIFVIVGGIGGNGQGAPIYSPCSYAGSAGYSDGAKGGFVGSWSGDAVDRRSGSGGGGGGSTHFKNGSAYKLCSADGGGGGGGGALAVGGYVNTAMGGKGGGVNGGAAGPSNYGSHYGEGNAGVSGGNGGSGGYTVDTAKVALFTGSIGARTGNGAASVTYIGRTAYG